MKQFFLFCCFVLTFFACVPDPCEDVVCGDQGRCEEGTCVCNDGYKQDQTGQCNISWNANLFGSWLVQDDCTTNDYPVVLGVSGGKEVYVNNFRGTYPIRMMMTSENTISIVAGSVAGYSRYYIESIEDAILNDEQTEFTLKYRWTDLGSNTVTDCTATWTK